VIGVAHPCVGDVELALTEACANVVRHAAGDDEYEVHVEITESDCQIRVIDIGHGFDHESLGRVDAAARAEQGRGIKLMRALVDNVKFVSRPEKGMVVHLVKPLDYDDHRKPPFNR
jgi:serine/threonine-protein kinase RsbW